MKIYRLLVLILSLSLLFGCNTDAITDPVATGDSPIESVKDVDVDENEDEAEGVLADENLDLLAVGNLLNEAEDGAEFEMLLNKNEGVNNLDLDGDGYVDYISVEEFEDRTDDQRGFTLLSRFGPNDVQEIASIILGRDRPDRPGATFYVRGNEQIYGNNYGYEGNWLDKSLRIARWVFGGRDNYYRSPYYYGNYPPKYTRYKVIKTPSYRKRVYKYQVNPAMIKITTPTMKIKIKSRYPGRSYRRVRAKLRNPTKAQAVFYKDNRGKPGKVQIGPGKAAKGSENGRGKGPDKKAAKPGKPGVDRKSGNDKGKGAGKPPGKQNVDKKGGNPGNKPKGNGGGGKGKGKG